MSKLLSRHSAVDEFEGMMEQFERTFESIWNRGQHAATLAVPIDVYEQGDDLFVRATIPGVKPEDLEVSVEANILTIRGESRDHWEGREGTRVYRLESRFGRFTRSIRLPQGLKIEEMDASMDNGILTVRIPKVPAQKVEVRQVAVKSSGNAPKPVLEAKNSGAEAQ